MSGDDSSPQPPAASGQGPVWGIDILWIPLGAGAHAARISGRVYEAVAATVGGRSRCDLYHSALQVYAPEGVYVIEQTPVPPIPRQTPRGVVARGSVGVRGAGRVRLFRYEIRRWLGGVIPDAEHAVGRPQQVTEDPVAVQRVLEVVPTVPTPVWGRDELRAGEMWNSNSVVSWALSRGGVDLTGVGPPKGGRAPGWQAGLVVAARQSRSL